MNLGAHLTFLALLYFLVLLTRVGHFCEPEVFPLWWLFAVIKGYCEVILSTIPRKFAVNAAFCLAFVIYFIFQSI
jgi:hypothetical protein